jgi:hypothetical protein
MSSKSSPAKPKISSPERKESGGAQPEELSSEERAEIALKDRRAGETGTAAIDLSSRPQV